jgi:hypothetical protein
VQQQPWLYPPARSPRGWRLCTANPVRTYQTGPHRSTVVTALKALLGTVIGITVHEFAISSHGALGRTNLLTGTSLAWGPMLLPFTAGTFLYVRMVAVIPELLEPGPGRSVQLKKTAQQFMAVAAGQRIMLSRRPLFSSGTTLLMCNPVLPNRR